jgi:predicted transcriptional regulator
MSPAKVAMLEAVGNLPESCTMDEVLDRVNLVAQVLEGIEDVEAGRVLTTEELLRQVEQWRG